MPRQWRVKSARQGNLTALSGCGGGGAAGATATAAGAAAAAPAGAGAPIVALTTCLQAGDRPATFRCRQASASLPPGVTPEHFAMKSERPASFSALCCAAVGGAAAAAADAAGFAGLAMAALGGAAGVVGATSGAAAGAGA